MNACRPLEIICLSFFQYMYSLCSYGCPVTHSVDQVVLNSQRSAYPASQVLVCATTAQLVFHI